MNLTSADVAAALEVLDVMSDDQVAALRAMILAVEDQVLAERRHSTMVAASPDVAPDWPAVEAALFFVVWASSPRSLARSL